VLAGSSASANAQGVPPGTYTQTCNSIFMLDNFTLQANCRQENGAFETSALDLRTCGGGSHISNNNGFLQCAGFSGARSSSYLQSCEFVSFSGNEISANCLSLAGALPFTSLDTRICVPGSDIANNNGKLQCNTV
jgi:CVNH domain